MISFALFFFQSAIIIHDIYEGCAAKRDGRLLVGDQILEVNSIDLRSATHAETIQALRQSTNIVRLLVLRREIINEDDKFDVITVDFIKKAGKGLGKDEHAERSNAIRSSLCRIQHHRKTEWLWRVYFSYRE